MLILCDFDNTITQADVTNLIWDHYFRPDWREVLLPRFLSGDIDSIELMQLGYKPVNAPATELLSFVQQRIGLREGFTDFASCCKARDWTLHIVTAGLDWYVRAYLPPGIPITALAAKLNHGWDVTLPLGVHVPRGQDYKRHMLELLRGKHTGQATVFIGDGRNDFPAARACDHVFALKDSTLESLCIEHGVKCAVFETFREIQQALERG